MGSLLTKVLWEMLIGGRMVGCMFDKYNMEKEGRVCPTLRMGALVGARNGDSLRIHRCDS